MAINLGGLDNYSDPTTAALDGMSCSGLIRYNVITTTSPSTSPVREGVQDLAANYLQPTLCAMGGQTYDHKDIENQYQYQDQPYHCRLSGVTRHLYRYVRISYLYLFPCR